MEGRESWAMGDKVRRQSIWSQNYHENDETENCDVDCWLIIRNKTEDRVLRVRYRELRNMEEARRKHKWLKAKEQSFMRQRISKQRDKGKKR